MKGPNHFAILRARGTSQDDFEDAVLSSYGVVTIWVQEFKEIREILKEVYTSVDGVTEGDWEALKEFKWWARSVIRPERLD